jgi:hypothetical protein
MPVVTMLTFDGSRAATLLSKEDSSGTVRFNPA